ncbi:T9SS type A sorting domain-containing protein [Polaribacter sp. Z014]|uniref:T9SS type A sorting domain-containing protein n=1 Tax=Polaribacter sp. Z014 TaxID=2927126 RepID=UPI00202194B1|nr:T9SS type A sorting domain-containing protein [Polaribacter sp. Z014]MCL7764771.1 T9SS type A sorting domain-containing protein [Polaribacter sp. Z014]
MKKIVHIGYFILFFIGCFQVKAQTINYKQEASKENSNFFEIVNKTRKQFIKKRKTSKTAETRLEKKANKQFERWVWSWKDRVNANGTFPKNQVNKEEYLNLHLNNSNKNAKTASTTKAWIQIGPKAIVHKNENFDYPGPGRVDVVAVDPNAADPVNPQIMYVGTPSGGLWKTTDAGTTWSPKTDHLAGMGVTDILIDPNNTNIIYMATGDRDSSYISSIGLFKSTDAGETWLPTGLTFTLSQNDFIRDIAFAPGSTTTIFALTNSEIKKSTDSGDTWVNSTVTYPYDSFTENFQTMVFDPNDAMKVVVSDLQEGIYYSTDGGNNFKLHDVYEGGTSQKILRITASPADEDHFYGINQDGEFKKYRFAFDDTAADLIKTTPVSANINGTPTPFESQAGYIQCIAVSPTNANNLMVGGVQGWKSTDNGDTFSPVLNAYTGADELPSDQIHVHADHHFLFFTDDSHIINGNDAGLRMGLFSPTSDSDFPDISSGLIITQSYNIAITHGLNGDDYMMANQDNDGFSKVEKDGVSQWVAAVAGDGTGTAIDIDNPSIRYLGGVHGELYRTDDGYASYYADATTVLPADKTNAEFISPIALHPTIATTIYAGHGDVKKSLNRGGTGISDWTALNSGLLQTAFLDVSLNSSAVRIFAIGQEAEVSTVKRSVDDGQNWTTIASPSGVAINSIYGVPNTNTVYATVKSYEAGKKVYKSIDNGTTWTNISGNLPNITMFKIILDPNKTNETIYLATEIGVYYTDNSTTDWSKLGTGLPNVRISDIKISANNGNVYVGTFGRGMWVYDDQKYFDNTIEANKYWSDTSSWEGENLPTDKDDVFIKAGESVTLDSEGAVAKSVEIADTGNLYIAKNADLTIENNFDSNSANSSLVQINSDVADSGVLIVKGSSTGNITYYRGGLLANNWSLITPPLVGQTVESFALNTDNDIRKNTDTGADANRYAIAKYNDTNTTNEKWIYFDVNVAPTEKFNEGKGYSISRATDGDLTFTGTLHTGALNVDAAHDKWIAVGNPYTAYYPANNGGSGDFLQDNLTKLDTEALAIYIWNIGKGKYDAYNAEAEAIVLAPAQGFFIKMKTSGTDEKVVFNNSKVGTKTSLTGNHTFNKTTQTTTSIKIFVAKGNLKVDTNIHFSENATVGFDAGLDIINFNTSEFDLTTKLLDNSTDKDYTIQSIPSNNYENQIIPLNLKGKTNEEITFSALNSNLPEGLKIFLEDKETGSYYELSNTKNYTLTLSSDTNGFGRFYVHFSAQALSVPENDVTKIEIYNQNNFLQIKGVNAGAIKINLFDLNGKNIFNQNQTADKFSPVDLNEFSKGVYLVKVTSEGKSVSKKIIID